MRDVWDDVPEHPESMRRALSDRDEREKRPRARAPSRRAQRLWDRLGDWYGARFYDQFGAVPSPDWCELVDGAHDSAVVSALSATRHRYVDWPPTFPQFAALVREARVPVALNQASTIERLTEFVVTHRRLTPRQHFGWTFLYRDADDGSAVCTGVVIPADDDARGYRVMVEDMQAEVSP